MPPIEWPAIAADGHLGPREQRAERRQRVGPNSPARQRQVLGRVRAVAADVEGQAVEPGGVEEQRHRQRPVARRFPAVDEDDARARRAAAGRDEPRRAGRGRRTRMSHRLVRQAEVGRA